MKRREGRGARGEERRVLRAAKETSGEGRRVHTIGRPMRKEPTMNVLSRVCFIALVALQVLPVNAEVLRCNGHFAQEGDSRLSVLYKCGQPLLADSVLRARVLLWNPPSGPGTVCEYLRTLSADGGVALRPRSRKLHGDGALPLRHRAVNHVQPCPSVAVTPSIEGRPKGYAFRSATFQTVRSRMFASPRPFVVVLDK